MNPTVSSQIKVAIVHDWLTLRGGAESCLEEFLHLFPNADIFCIVDFLPDSERKILLGRPVVTSFIQRLPGAKKWYRSYLPLMPIAIEQLDVTGYDIVISSSAAVAKGVITGPDQIHISYCHSPIRYAWDLQHQYLRESGVRSGVKGFIARLILHYIRIWDSRTSNGVDHFIANSDFIARRIRKVYGRQSTVIYPPVDLDKFSISFKHESYYVTMSRMVPYKRIPLIVEAFREMPERHLIVIGDGPEMPSVVKAASPNVTILGKQPDDVAVDLIQRAKAFVFAAEEDFGIAPVEAQACGTPVVAYGKGGALETVRGEGEDGQTGVFFSHQSVEAIVSAIDRLDLCSSSITPEACRKNAERFSRSLFRTRFLDFVSSAVSGKIMRY